MIRDNSEKTMDTKIIDDLLWTDLNQESIQSYRRRHMIISPKHPWEKLPDDQYLVMIGAAARTESGVRPTAAGLLMFGAIIISFVNSQSIFLIIASMISHRKSTG